MAAVIDPIPAQNLTSNPTASSSNMNKSTTQTHPPSLEPIINPAGSSSEGWGDRLRRRNVPNPPNDDTASIETVSSDGQPKRQNSGSGLAAARDMVKERMKSPLLGGIKLEDLRENFSKGVEVK